MSFPPACFGDATDSTNTQGHKDSRQLVKAKYCYPGEDTTSSNKIFLSLYEEEQAFEEPGWPEDHELSGVDAMEFCTETRCETTYRPTIYFVSRIFDSIKGFHKGYLDLSGRHPERYYQLQSQWNRFLWGLLRLDSAVEPPEYLDLLGVVHARQERWRRFLTKWRLPESTSYNQLIQCAQSVLRELKQYPMPLFQMTRLTGLPSEILDNIMGLANPDQAQALSNTCHRLNNIGQRHIFATWPMKFRVPPYVSPFNVEYSSFDLPTLANFSRKDFERNAQYILRSPHIAHHVKRLILSDEWCVNRRAHPHENNPFALGVNFYASITRIFATVLRAATNVTELVLYNLEVNVDLIRKIGDNHSLHTVEFHSCHIPRMVRRRLTSDPNLICPRIANLRIYVDSSFAETHTQWYTILLCPHARTLSVIQSGVGPFPAPDALFWLHSRFNSLERLVLDNIDAPDLAELVKLFRRSASASAHMTHLKLHMDWGISDAEALSLLLVLNAAPLEVLVLEGLAEAESALFEQIAYQYPALLSLTVVRRQNSSQHHNKFATWPHASWEYAPCFRRFRALRHFCWNFRTEYWDATPSALLAFEANFALPAVAVPYRPGPVEIDLTDGAPPYFLDTHWMALPFAAHCPTLQSFSLMDRTVDMMCKIARHPTTGETNLAPKYHPTHSFVSWNTQQWNTAGAHWPPLLPKIRVGH
ncbi:hypothetical protein HYPSUDRAFT_64870 [Hypholoma sublateritium FD-334 SS-4]|uniref:F-box domain-containing protein n=1 Tax=Hypholoma sublateritium (strain FD-334 SS-4) TaxID=945553 RepID=A0A0D2LD52_HYPSF|nr:hypothetical protein HYPSUDRAFT_64870 [Hypholoma sublateritium FD-334 SS-4]